jgi:hypothetical protein
VPQIDRATKLDLLTRYTRDYGAAAATALVPLLPLASQEKGALAIGCESKEAAKCVLLAKAQDDAKDPAGALDYYDRACQAGSGDACFETGKRLLRSASRDPARAILALERGCAASNGRSCARLARVYEEGDGTDANAIIAASLRYQACDAGVGASCRRLALSTEDADAVHALWVKGCQSGDAVSCTLVRLSSDSEPAHPAATPPPANPAGSLSFTTPPPSRDRRSSVAAGLIVVGAIAGAGALMMKEQDSIDDHFRDHYGRGLSVVHSSSGPRVPLAAILGTGAVLAAGTGIILFATKPPDPEKPKVSVGVSPGGLSVSGTMP